MHSLDPERPTKTPGKKSGNGKKKPFYVYPLKIFFLTFFLSAAFSYGSGEALSYTGNVFSVILIIIIILVNIVFDIIGTAVTAAEETPLHSMSSRKVNGSREAVALLKNAGKVSNFCNDVVGDMAGIVSGACGAVLVARFASGHATALILLNLVITALIAALTVGGKALGKHYAIRNGASIVFLIGRILYGITHLFRRKEKNNRTVN